MAQPSASPVDRAELEAQIEALRYAAASAEGASERFSALFSSVPLALFVVDEDSLVLECNGRALDLFRPAESDPPLNFLFPLVSPGHLDRVTHALARAQSDGHCDVTGVVFVAGSGPSVTGDLHIAHIGSPAGTDHSFGDLPAATGLSGEPGNGAPGNGAMENRAQFICAIVDQGPLLAEKAQRDTLEAQLRESQKMQAIGTLAGGIAHDFNNILAAILGNVALARQDAGVGSPAQVSLLEIDKAARRARELVRQILAFGRKEPLSRSVIHLAPVVQEAVNLARVGLPPGVELTVHVHDAAALTALADATQVQQAVLNLCTNAIQALGGGHGQVTVTLAASAQGATVAVSDTGAGIAPADLQHIFEPFFTTKAVGQGTGLGLAVVHGVMRAHEGSVSAHSTPGQGSVFTLQFPPVTAHPPDAPTASAPIHGTAALPRSSVAPPAAKAGQGQRVMYVDDDTALVFLVDRALTRKGFQVRTFTDPHAALAALAEPATTCDLLVSDHNMPGMSGVDLLREARTLRPTLPMALASGYATADIEQAAYAAGAQALIHKPHDVDEMVQTVARLLQPHSP